MAPVARANDRAAEPEGACGNSVSGTPRRGSTSETFTGQLQHTTPFPACCCWWWLHVGESVCQRGSAWARAERVRLALARRGHPRAISQGLLPTLCRGRERKRSTWRVIIPTSSLTDLHVCFVGFLLTTRSIKPCYIRDSATFIRGLRPPSTFFCSLAFHRGASVQKNNREFIAAQSHTVFRHHTHNDHHVPTLPLRMRRSEETPLSLSNAEISEGPCEEKHAEEKWG